MRKRTRLAAVALALASTVACAESPAPSTSRPTTTPTTLFNGWSLTPAGTHHTIGDMPLKLAFSPDRRLLASVSGGLRAGVSLYDVPNKKLLQTAPLPRCWNGLAFSKDGKSLYVTGGNSDNLYVFTLANNTLTLARTLDLDPVAAAVKNRQESPNFFAAVAVHPDSGKLYLCNEATSEIWVVNPTTGKVDKKFATGAYPHTCLFASGHLFVSNWGDRSVYAIDPDSGKRLARFAVGVRPNDMALAPDGRLFIACAGDNSVHVVRTRVLDDDAANDTTEAAPPPAGALEIISTSLYPDSPEGSTPCAVAVSPDGRALFVANCDNNDAVVVDISDPEISKVNGFVPTGWYPTAIATDGKQLFVGNGKGLASRPSVPPISPAQRTVGGTRYDHPTGVLSGSLSVIDEPTPADLAQYTAQVRKNSPYTPAQFHATATTQPADSIIPTRVGQDCPIKYVLYIIKENRTYDQVLGDMTDATGKPIGNGDPKLTLFGEKISPNHHQLAREYVLLDNLYCNGEVSVDGHSWSDGAISTDFRTRSWVVGYTKHGALRGNDEMEHPVSGYLWDACRRAGLSYRSYGEMTRLIPTANRGKWPSGRDMHKVDSWIKDLHAAEESNSPLPRFTVMSLGEDHTRGTQLGQFTPQAMVASNDQALGKIVAAASRSKFWNEMAIFVIEDDAQNGPDHVDAHRTVGFVISPYTKRNTVDSTLYTTTSMLRTMELILGLPPMTQYDAAATPMHNCFTKTPTLTPYTLKPPQIDLNAKNTKDSYGWQASGKMDFDEFDEAPEDELNRILWAAIKGKDAEYPTPIHRAVFFTK